MVTYIVVLIVLALLVIAVLISFIRTFPKLARPYISWGKVIEWKKSNYTKSFGLEYYPIVEFKYKDGRILKQEIKDLSAGLFRPETKSSIILLIGENKVYAASIILIKIVTYFGIIGLIIIYMVKLIKEL
jgi:hypothetical protein